MTKLHRLFILPFVGALIAIALSSSVALGAQSSAAGSKNFAKALNILKVDQIHKGMKGYGLTIFSGSKIEPFPVEVVSVVSEAAPKRAVIWITCPGKRLQRSGPVEGMSGSPIYLWTDSGKKHKIGEGGRLIGAFAFGFSLSKGCLAGVQPIQYMLKIPGSIESKSTSAGTSPSDTSDAKQALATLGRLKGVLARKGQENASGELIAFCRLLLSGQKPSAAFPQDSGFPKNRFDADNRGRPVAVSGPSGKVSSGVHPLLIPLNVGSTQLASDLAPLLKPLGLNPVAGGLIAGAPPKNVDPSKVKLAPGSAVMIPLAFGDLDLYGGGTVTTVLPNGVVLAFGHPMFGQGHESLPMATGYVNFIVPLLTASFKMMGSLKIVGSMVEDQSTGIAGIIGAKRYKTAPASITVQYPHRPAHQYHYQIVNRLGLTPTIAAVLAIQSINAVHQMPPLYSLHVKGSVTFTGGRTIKIDSVSPNASPMAVVGQLLPIVATMTQNQYQRLKLTGMNLVTKITPGVDLSTLTNASVDQTIVAPGGTLNITVQLRPYGKSIRYQTVQLKLPDDIKPGDYSLVISGARAYARQFASSHPYLFDTKSVDDIWHSLQRVLEIKSEKMYVTMRLKKSSLAIGRMNMPDLPSSVEALITAPTNTYATKYNQILSVSKETDHVIEGNIRLGVHVRDLDKIARK